MISKKNQTHPVPFSPHKKSYSPFLPTFHECLSHYSADGH